MKKSDKNRTNILLKTIVFLIIVVMNALPTMAAWVENIPTTIKNPDGSVIECFVSGDEFFNYLHDKQGYTIIQSPNGYFYYAIQSGDTLKASTYRAGMHDPSAMGIKTGLVISAKEYQSRKDLWQKGIEPKTNKASHTGTLNNIVVYVRFSDDAEFTTPRSSFDAKFNHETATSVKTYFKEVSYDMVTVESHHYPVSAMDQNISYQDTYPRSYFQPYNAETNPDGYTSSQRTEREHLLLQRAVASLSVPSDINLDNDNDGRVDNVCFIIKGDNGAWASILWAHRWALYTTNAYINGKRVWDYTFQPETQATVQILNHELFHTFGAPDLYRYTNTGITPVGPWDLMHSGSGHMGAYMKWKYTNQTWINEIPVISEPGTYSLNPLTSPDNNAFRINSPNSSDEYFIVEYRKKETDTYESSLPASGLLIYRINPLAGNGNANGPPDEVYLYRPNGTNSLNGLVYNANYSAESGRTEITDATTPSSFLSTGNPGGLIISNISPAGSTISFDLFGGSSESVEITTEASPSYGGNVTGGGTWYKGQTVTLNASPAANFTFNNWSENGTIVSSDARYTFTASASRHLRANFVSATPVYSINATANPTSGGSISGTGNYQENETVTLTATAAEGHNFVNWTEGGNVISSQSQISFLAEKNRSLTANFTINTYQISVSASPAQGGSVSGEGSWDHGTLRAVNAQPATGYSFVNWTENGAEVSTNSNYIFQLKANRNLTANFQGNTVTSFTVSLQANPSQGGSVTGGGAYEQGQQVDVSATPSAGYSFINWTEGGTVVSSNKNYSFTANSNRSLTANFSLNTHTITLNAQPVQGGTISGGGGFDYGQTATVSAAPALGYTFVNWTQNGTVVSTTAAYSFTVSSNRSLTANFSANTYTITLNANPTHGGTVSGGGGYDYGQTATLSAAPATGYTFVNWTQNGTVVSTTASYTFTVSSNRSLTANFTANAYIITLNANPTQGGNVAGGGGYAYGQTATVTAAAESGYTFVNWTQNGTEVSTNASYSFTVNTNRSLTANFSTKAYTITLNAQPTQGGSATGGGGYNYGQTATVTATPATGYTFVNWKENGNVVSTLASYSFTVSANRSLTANFSTNTYTVALNAQPTQGGAVTGDGSYNYGQTATVTAAPANGYTFVNWSEDGNVISTSASYSFAVSANRSLTANFSTNAYSITLNASPTQGGTISGGGNYTFGQTATVSADPATGYIFVNWTENGTVVSTHTSYSFTVESNRLITANFTLTTHTLTLASQPLQGGTVSGAGIYEYGQQAAVSATANEGFVFRYWMENGEIISYEPAFTNETTVNRHLTAIFQNIHAMVKIDARSEPAGFAFINGAGLYNEKDQVVLKATPADSRFEFVGWTENGEVISTQESIAFSAEKDRNIIAAYEYKARYYDVEVEVESLFDIPIRGVGNYMEGEEVTLEIELPRNVEFRGWQNAAGQIVSRRNPYHFEVMSHVKLEAILSLNESYDEGEQIKIYPNPNGGEFWIYAENAYQLQIRTTTGDLLWSQELEEGENYVNISWLPLGMYLINLYGDERAFSRKIIIK